MTQAPAATRPTCLFGSIVNDDGSITRDQYIVLSGGRIQSVGNEKPPGVRKPQYTLAADELVFPAFLDLHTHASYNMLPLWHSPFWAWDNRFQWRGNASYKQSIAATNHAISATYGHGSRIYQAFNAFSELMAIAGGTTVLQENAHLDAEGYPGGRHVLIRSTGSAGDMALQANEQIVSVTDFYEPDPYTAPRDPVQDTGRWGVKAVAKGRFDGTTYLADFAQSVTGTRTRGTIVHLAEGRSGFMQTRLGVDAYTRAEFEAFKTFVSDSYKTPEDVARVRQARLLLIHGCGMNTVSDRDLAPEPAVPAAAGRPAGSACRHSTIAQTIDFLKTYGIGVIWSPVSNLLLYQDTTNVLPLLDAGIPVVLGTDWSPSGSKTVWEEAKFAAEVLQAHRWPGDIDLTCFRAITSVAADSLGLPLGRVKAGNFADLLIVRRPAGARRAGAMAAFRKATDADVRAVFVGGVPLYGDADLLRQFGADARPLPEEQPAAGQGVKATVASTKAIALPAGCEITLEELTQAIEAADHVIGRDRPKFLAADDPDYRARMDELRAWVRGFDARTSPNPRPVPAPPSGLAPGELEWMYNASLDPAQRLPDDVADLLGRVAPCRDVACEVPRRHPYYHAEVLTQAGDSYGMRVPCMPVVPVLTNKGQLFVMGDYPTAKFSARSTNNLPVITFKGDGVGAANEELQALLHVAAQQPHGGDPQLQTYIEEIGDVLRQAVARPDIDPDAGAHGQAHAWGHEPYVPPRKNQFFVPVGDVFAPMQDADYFDGYKVRNVAAGVFMQEYYLKAVGVDIGSQVWLTNMIKCFLFHQSMASSYQALGWSDVKVEQSYSELLPVAKVCSQWINEEVQVCKPKLVLTVGKPPCTLLHDLPLDDPGIQGRVYNTLLGQLLKAGDTTAETNIAKNLKLTRRAAVAVNAQAAPAPAPQPLSIRRTGPWAAVNVFHMLHPQAVMMSQTGATAGLVAAIQAVLGPTSSGLDANQLRSRIDAYLKKHSTADLIKALPYGQRDQFRTNARMLELHAVTLANLADVLVKLKLVSQPDGEAVLQAQAHDLASNYHLADTPKKELLKLRALRSDKDARFAALSR